MIGFLASRREDGYSMSLRNVGKHRLQSVSFQKVVLFFLSPLLFNAINRPNEFNYIGRKMIKKHSYFITQFIIKFFFSVVSQCSSEKIYICPCLNIKPEAAFVEGRQLWLGGLAGAPFS
jgi:hypothetical protein